MKSVIVDGSYTHTLSIPDEWEFSELKNVINLVGGNQPPKSKFLYEEEEDTVRLIQIRDYKSDQHKVFIRKSDAKRFVEPTDVMIGRYGPPIFQILRGLKGAYNVALMKAEPVLGSFDKDYLYYYLSNQDLYNYVNSASDRTAGQSGVNKEHLEKYPVPVVPLAEQQEIVRQLDIMLAQVEQIKARLDAIPTILKKFRQSVLESYFNNLASVQQVNLDDLVVSIDQGWSPKCLNTPASAEQWGVIKTSAIQPLYFDASENKELPSNLKPREALSLISGDVLITRAGPRARCGVTCIVDKDYDNLMICDKVYRVRCDSKKISADYLNLYLNSLTGLSLIEKMKTGSSESGMNLTQSKFKELVIPLVSLKQQLAFAKDIKKFFQLANYIEETVQSAQKRVNLLTQSILAKAFSGELTAEWREQHQELITGVNSAESLLAKIQAEREASKSAKKTRKKKEV